MCAVGLSFGSPTSGDGFDVSTTVASIVSNLKNVETPWKTQLTTLQAQDTTISSLGTLFSNLSNTMSTLTDFSGVLAQKEGSSSNDSVLTLTAADNTAVAGTHVVTVSNLAQTSSGYLALISNASDTLSGSITLQVGTGSSLTVTMNSSINTLSALAKTINSSGVGITASVLTDSAGSRLSLVSGTSGANGNITVSNNSITDTTASLSASVTAGTATTQSSATLASIVNASDTIKGTLTIAVGSGTTQTFTIGSTSGTAAANNFYTGSGSGDNTLSALATTINNASIGVTASVVTSDGSSHLSLVSNDTGSANSLKVTSKIVDFGQALGYTSPVTGTDAKLTVDGVSLTSSSNTVANLIPGVTFQLLSPSTKESDGTLSQIQVVIANDNVGVESAVDSMVSSYNSLLSAINVQEGKDSSGNPEPLFGSPTLSLLQQQLLGGLNKANPNGYMTSVSATTNTTLSGSVSLQVGSNAAATVIIGARPSGAIAANTYYTGSGVNTLSGLAATINAASCIPLSYSGASASSTTASSGTLTSISSASDTVSGSITIQVGATGTTKTIVVGSEPSSGAAENTYYTGSLAGDNTLNGVINAINSANIGVSAGYTTAADGSTTMMLTSGTTGSAGTLTVVPYLTTGIGTTASVETTSGQSTLTLASQTEGSSGGTLKVTPSLTATSDTALTATVKAGTDADSSTSTSATTSSATLSSITKASDTLIGSITIQAGSDGTAQTVTLPSSGGTLSSLASAINTANIGVSASVVTNSDGSSSLSIQSGTSGTAGSLTVTSNILDATNTTTNKLSYTSSSDINSLTTLGFNVNNDGTISLDSASLYSVLISDYSSIVGFFQNTDSWGQGFSSILTNAGTSSSKGILSLASTSNSNIESTLNANISKEELLISSQQKSITAELNSANEIMQAIPTQINGVNELYSAITGYNQSK